ncbi:hypothetical protein T484DRAFT_1766125 [Baffinella frigidus]|nr:hypothetical protein T484DRAFT_1766125 [Cryptophyta sp. CCMP2293]
MHPEQARLREQHAALREALLPTAAPDWDAWEVGGEGGILRMAPQGAEGGAQVVCLLPLIDAANHEIRISYGSKSSGEWLATFGFVPPPGENPGDSVVILEPLAFLEPFLSGDSPAEALGSVTFTQDLLDPSLLALANLLLSRLPPPSGAPPNP